MDLSKWSHLVEDWEFYRSHQEELVKLYDGKVLVLHEKRVAGAFGNSDEAEAFGNMKFGLGKYLIQECSPGDKDLVVNFYSGVRI